MSRGVRIWKCYEFLPNQCFANIPKVTRVNVPLTVLIVYRVPLCHKKTNRVSVFCMSHSSRAKSRSSVLEVVELTLSCYLTRSHSFGGGRGCCWRSRKCKKWEVRIGRVAVPGARRVAMRRSRWMRCFKNKEKAELAVKRGGGRRCWWPLGKGRDGGAAGGCGFCCRRPRGGAAGAPLPAASAASAAGRAPLRRRHGMLRDCGFVKALVVCCGSVDVR